MLLKMKYIFRCKMENYILHAYVKWKERFGSNQIPVIPSPNNFTNFT